MEIYTINAVVLENLSLRENKTFNTNQDKLNQAFVSLPPSVCLCAGDFLKPAELNLCDGKAINVFSLWSDFPRGHKRRGVVGKLSLVIIPLNKQRPLQWLPSSPPGTHLSPSLADIVSVFTVKIIINTSSLMRNRSDAEGR